MHSDRRVGHLRSGGTCHRDAYSTLSWPPLMCSILFLVGKQGGDDNSRMCSRQPIGWKWTEGQTRRFFIQVQVQLAEVLVFRATSNTDVRVTEVQLNINSDCKAVSPVGKRGWELSCSGWE